MSLTRPKSGSTREPAGSPTPVVSAPRPSQRAPGTSHRSGTARPSIQLHIEELVLHGFSPHDRHHIADAVQNELTRLLADRGLPQAHAPGAGLDRADAGGFHVSREDGIARIGEQVAACLYRSLDQDRRPDAPLR